MGSGISWLNSNNPLPERVSNADVTKLTDDFLLSTIKDTNHALAAKVETFKAKVEQALQDEQADDGRVPMAGVRRILEEVVAAEAGAAAGPGVPAAEGLLAATLESTEALRSTLALASSYFRKTHKKDIPDAFAVKLAGFALERTVLDLRLPEKFTFRMEFDAVRQADLPWSKRNVQVFCFNQETPTKLKVNYVRAYDNDMVRVDTEAAEITTEVGHWMAGSTTQKSPLAPPLAWFKAKTPQRGADPKVASRGNKELPSSAAEIVSQWFDLGALLDSGRAVLVHPGDEGDDEDNQEKPEDEDEKTDGDDTAAAAAAAADDGNRSGTTVGLCDEAKGWLREGYSLLLVKGTPVRVALPAGRSLRIAGAIFAKTTPRGACKLEAMIIPEAASHEEAADHGDNWENDPIIAPQWYSRGTGMFQWDVRDIYRFEPEANW
jgi:hypothetical protein